MFMFFSYLLFLPSITFGILESEIFPWAILFSILYMTSIDKRFLILFMFFIFSSIYGYYLSGGLAAAQVLRSFVAYVNPILIFTFLIKVNYNFIEKLLPISKNIFYFLLIFGFLQSFGIINFLDPAIKLLIPRGTASSLENFGRGVTLLSTEPSRASYEFIFIYLVFRTVFLNKRYHLIIDLFITYFVLFIIQSLAGIITLFVFLIVFYRLKFVLLSFLLACIIFLYWDLFVTEFFYSNSRAIQLAIVLANSSSLEDIYNMILNASGFRLISIIASFKYGFYTLIGGGIGNWEISSLESLNLTNYKPADIQYFIDSYNAQWNAIRPTSFVSALMLDVGIVGIIIVFVYFYQLLKNFFKTDKVSRSVIIFFFFYLVCVGSVGNPVPFITTALILKYLYSKNI